jgi:anti-anti-sigma factor
MESPSTPRTQLVEIDAHEGWTVCTLAGELNLVRVAELRAALKQLGNPDRLALDLTHVPAIDRHALTLLLSHLAHLRDQGCRVALCGASGPVARFLHITGTATHIDTCSDRASLPSTNSRRPSVTRTLPQAATFTVGFGARDRTATARGDGEARRRWTNLPPAIRRLVPGGRLWESDTRHPA